MLEKQCHKVMRVVLHEFRFFFFYKKNLEQIQKRVLDFCMQNSVLLVLLFQQLVIDKHSMYQESFIVALPVPLIE